MVRYLSLCVAVLTGGAVTAQDVRNRSLEEAVGLLTKDVKEGLGGAKPEVFLGTFGPHKRANAAAQSNAAPEVVRLLTESLAKADVKVVRGRANFTVTGTYMEVEDQKSGMQIVKLEFTLTDKEAGKDREYSQLVTNQVAVQKFLGISNEVPPNAGPKDRFVSFKKEVDKFIPSSPEKPKPALKDGQIKPGPGSPFAIEVFTAAPNADPKQPHKISDYALVVPKDEDGLAFVKIDRGHVYGIQITNTADFDAAVSLNIDGLSMFVACDKEDPASKKKLRDDKGQPLHNFIVVEKGKKVFIQGWFVNLKETDEFLVTEYAKSLSSQFQAPSGQVGVITCCFHAAVPKDQPFPAGEPTNPDEFSQSADGTGKGARVQSPYEQVERKIGLLRAAVSVRYSK